jgi:hypothetical protein
MGQRLCNECPQPLGELRIKVLVRNPQRMRGEFSVCSQPCADKLRVRVTEKGWEVISVIHVRVASPGELAHE